MKRNNKFLLIILVLTLFVLSVGGTFTLFSLISSQTKDATKIYSGSLEISYRDGNIIHGEELIPISEPAFGDTEYVYTNNFSVLSNGTVDQTISISLILTENGFTNNALKYKLFNSNHILVSSGSIPNTGIATIMQGIAFPSVHEENYTLMIWLQETNTNQDVDRNKRLIGTISVEAIQIRY